MVFNDDQFVTLLRETLKQSLKESLKEFFDEYNSPKPEPQQNGGIEFAAQILGKSKSWLYKMAPLLPHKKFGNSLRFDRAALEAWRDQNMEDPFARQEIVNNALAESARRRMLKN